MPLLDAAPEAEAPWLVMEYLPGQSLREAVASLPYSADRSGGDHGLAVERLH